MAKEYITTDKGQRLLKLGPRERKTLEWATSTNRRAAHNYKLQLQREKGPTACAYCGAEPCGWGWTQPGSPEPAGERCCSRCTHEPVEGWMHTHTAWKGGHHFPVCALRMREGEVVYMRRDGVVLLLELHAPQPGSDIDGAVDSERPMPVFLGRGGGAGLYLAGEGGIEDANLWEGKTVADELWLAIRVQGAIAKEEQRKAKVLAHMKEVNDDLDRRYAQIVAEREAKQQADIERRQLKHETVTVLREMQELEAAVTGETSEQEVEAPGPSGAAERASEADAGREPKSQQPSLPSSLLGGTPTPAAAAEVAEEDLTPAQKGARTKKARLEQRVLDWKERRKHPSKEDLRKPAEPQPTSGRLKRSKRQRAAVERANRLQAQREARARLELRRLARVGKTLHPEAAAPAAPTPREPADLVKEPP